jgi:hypothetical protein
MSWFGKYVELIIAKATRFLADRWVGLRRVR